MRLGLTCFATLTGEDLPRWSCLAAMSRQVIRADPDAIVRLAEHDPRSAAQQLVAQLTPKPTTFDDWPDRLASTLRVDPFVSLADWGSLNRMNPR